MKFVIKSVKNPAQVWAFLEKHIWNLRFPKKAIGETKKPDNKASQATMN